MLKVLIADDHPVFRRGLKQMIEESPDLVVAGEAATGEEVVRKAASGAYDLVVLDISMPLGDGIEALQKLKHDRPAVPVLMLSMHPEEQYALQALRAGAAGYVTKESAADELLVAIRKVIEGGNYVSASLAQHLLASLVRNEPEPSDHHLLSEREHEVMRMIASGRTVSQIARELSLSVKTVSTHRARILKKLNMKTNAELIRHAAKTGLV